MQARVLAGCTLGNSVGTTASVHSVFGVFLVPLSLEFGWPRAGISVALGIIALTGAIVYPVAGRHADRHGARRMVILGNILFALSVAALALTSGSLPQFYLTFALVGIFGALCGTPIFSKVIADWFGHNRGTALGISAGVGTALGSILMPVAAALLLSYQGWRAAYIGVAALMLAIGLPALLFLLRDGPRYRNAGAGTDGAPDDGMALAGAMRTPAFWLVLVAIATGAGCTTAIFSHVVPILGDRGIGIATGTAVVSTFALVGSLWQIATGRMLDRIDRAGIVIPMYLMAILGLAMLETVTGTAALIAGGALLGIGLGSQYGALPYFIARYFGLRAFGTIIGVMYSAIIAAQGITPVLLDASYDAHGSYRLALVVAGICLAVGAGLILLLPRFPDGRPVDDALAAAVAH